jgi:hypothetical protein
LEEANLELLFLVGVGSGGGVGTETVGGLPLLRFVVSIVYF